MGFGPVRWRSWQAAAGPWSAAAREAQAAGRRVNDAGERCGTSRWLTRSTRARDLALVVLLARRSRGTARRRRSQAHRRDAEEAGVRTRITGKTSATDGLDAWDPARRRRRWPVRASSSRGGEEARARPSSTSARRNKGGGGEMQRSGGGKLDAPGRWRRPEWMEAAQVDRNRSREVRGGAGLEEAIDHGVRRSFCEEEIERS